MPIEDEKDNKPSAKLPTIIVEDWDQPEVVRGNPFLTPNCIGGGQIEPYDEK